MKKVFWGLFYFIFFFGLAGGAWVFLKNTGTSLPAPDLRLEAWLANYTIDQPLAIAVTRYRNVVYHQHFGQQHAGENEDTHHNGEEGDTRQTIVGTQQSDQSEKGDDNGDNGDTHHEKGDNLQRGNEGANQNKEKSRDTQFPIGQVADGLTALAFMSLEERGELSLDTNLADLLDSVPAAWANTTPRALLTHRAETVMDSRDEKGYCAEDYIWLTRILERVTGQSASLFIKERVLAPLEMKDTHYLDSPTAGWYSTLDDMLKWEDGLNSNRVVRMKTLLTGLRAEKVGDAWWHFNFGWQVENFGGLRMEQLLSRGGLSGASITRFPEKNFAVVVLGGALPEGLNEEEIGWRIGEIYLDREMPRVLLEASKQKKNTLP